MSLPSRARLAGVTTVAALTALLTGCGSTVGSGALPTAAAPGGDGLAAPGSPVAPGAPVAPGPGAAPGAGTPDAPLAGAPGPGTVAVGQPTQLPSSGAVAGQQPAAYGAIARTGKGWDATTVYIGVNTQKDVQTAFESVGASGLDAGDQEAQALAMESELNRLGGLFGRKVKIVFRDHGTVATATDPDSTGQATCTYFTQDRPVVALLNPVTLMDVPSFRSCLARAKVPLFSASVAAVDTEVGRQLAPYFYQSVAPTWNALAPTLVARLKAQGYFGGWNATTGTAAPGTAKVGVLVVDDTVGARVATVVSKALTSAGIGAPVVYRYSPDANDNSAAVLQFRGNDVTHVIVTDSSMVGFTLAAANQGYRPRYGVSTYNAPLSLLEGTAPDEQLVGSVGVGWSPPFDVGDAADPGPTGPVETECARIMKARGQTFQGKRLAEAVAFAFCDGLRLIVAGAAAGGGLGGPAIAQGIEKVGRQTGTAFSFASGLGGGRLFVPGAVRDLSYRTDCQCYRYVTRTNHAL